MDLNLLQTPPQVADNIPPTIYGILLAIGVGSVPYLIAFVRVLSVAVGTLITSAADIARAEAEKRKHKLELIAILKNSLDTEIKHRERLEKEWEDREKRFGDQAQKAQDDASQAIRLANQVKTEGEAERATWAEKLSEWQKLQEQYIADASAKDATIMENQQTIAERDKVIVEKDKVITELQKRLTDTESKNVELQQRILRLQEERDQLIIERNEALAHLREIKTVNTDKKESDNA